MQIADTPSPNFGPRRGGVLPDMVVLHYTAMASAEAAAARLRDPETEVSAHYLIGLTGQVQRLVAEEMRAWHAGAGCWGGVRDVNSRSIGIELANRGEGPCYHPFPEPQMAALEALLAGIMDRWAIAPARVVGHACVAPGRKIDPGAKFDWRRLARRGLAVWREPIADPRPAEAAAFQRAARRFGYGLEESGTWDPATLAIWHAFAARFRPAAAAAPPDRGGLAQLEALARDHPVALDPVAAGA